MRMWRWLAVWILVAGVAGTAAAQTDAGRVSGTVRDRTNAFVRGVTITVKNEKTGETRTIETNEQGYFLIPQLKPSSYTISARLAGFAPIEYTAMNVAVGQELALDLELQPEGGREALTVTAAAPVLDISSARMGVNVSEREIQELPVNGRQMSQLLLQAPGALNSGSGTWGDIRFSGRALNQNVVRYDGIEGSAIIDASPGNLNGEIASPFRLQASLENVQEFRVESSNYPAEYGTGTGGQVSVITKSGGNRMHGSIFEFFRDDALDAPNYFEKVAGLPQSELSLNQFGFSTGGPIVKDRAFFFASYEGYRLNAGVNFIEAVPSQRVWDRAVAAVQPLRPAFTAQGAVLLPGASNDPDADIYQLQGVQDVNEDAYSARVDFRISNGWSSYVRFFHDQGTNNQPEGVTGRVFHVTDNPTNVVFNLQGLLGRTALNEFKVGYNSAPTRTDGIAPTIPGVDLSGIALNLTSSVANTGIAGQGSSSGWAVPGGLVRANSATNGRGQPYDPYSLTLADSVSRTFGTHYARAGAEFRMIRMETDRLGGTTYSYANVDNFSKNIPASVQYLGDLSDPSAFNNGATGPRHTEQEYLVGYLQDEWRARTNFTLNYGLRYDYYTPLRERDNLVVRYNVDTGTIDPNTTALFEGRKNSFQPRVSATYAPTAKTVFRGGFGMFVGPGQTEDQVQPVESDRIASTFSSGAFNVYPIDISAVRNNFINNPTNRSFQPRAYTNDYNIPERVYQYTGSVQREIGNRMALTAAYVGSQGRNLFLRSVTNEIVSLLQPDPTKAAVAVRQWSIVNADGTVSNPYAEIDIKTSGGHDSYNAMMLSLTRRSANGLTMNAQYTLAKSWGNTAGSNEAQTAANNATAIDEFDYDIGYNNFDVRHNFNVSALYSLPFGHGQKFMNDADGLAQVLLGNWDIGGIINARSGLPVPVQIARPDIVYVDSSGNVFTSPAADRVGVVNAPGGGNSRNVRRPDLIPGVDPFIQDGGVLLLNPAAFATPKPGTFGNLTRNSIHGPNFLQTDFLASKKFEVGGTRSFEFRLEVFNIFNRTNFANPPATLAAALPSNNTTESNKLQPGQAYTAAAAGGTWGKATSTVTKAVGLGTNRQMQLGLRINF